MGIRGDKFRDRSTKPWNISRYAPPETDGDFLNSINRTIAKTRFRASRGR